MCVLISMLAFAVFQIGESSRSVSAPSNFSNNKNVSNYSKIRNHYPSLDELREKYTNEIDVFRRLDGRTQQQNIYLHSVTDLKSLYKKMTSEEVKDYLCEQTELTSDSVNSALYFWLQEDALRNNPSSVIENMQSLKFEYLTSSQLGELVAKLIVMQKEEDISFLKNTESFKFETFFVGDFGALQYLETMKEIGDASIVQSLIYLEKYNLNWARCLIQEIAEIDFAVVEQNSSSLIGISKEEFIEFKSYLELNKAKYPSYEKTIQSIRDFTLN